MRRGLGATIFVVAVIFGLGGCMLGPDYERPETPADLTADYEYTPGEWVDPNNPEAIGAWWESFGDPVTAELVREALENNYDLKIAAARVVESEALLAQAFGARLPQVNYGLDRTRAKNAFVQLGVPLSTLTTAWQQSFSVNYITDLFGKLRRAERAAFADMLATKESQQAIVHAVIAQVVRVRSQIATQQDLLNISQENIKSRKETLQIVDRRYSQGLVPPLDVHLARENLASVTSLEPLIRQNLILAQNSLDVLLGRVPSTTAELPETLPDVPDLSPVPLAVPASLLDRRPDVRAAEMQLSAATERVGFSVASMFPDLTIGATWGTRSESFRGLGFSEAEVYSLVMQLMTPVFAGGRLKAGVDAAKARTEQAAANYAKVVLNAMREVEDALVEHQTLVERMEQLKMRLVEATSAEKLARQRYQRGLEKILIVTDTEQRRRLAENELAITMGNIYNARINLYLALGGDWQPVESAMETENSESDNGDDGNAIEKQEI